MNNNAVQMFSLNIACPQMYCGNYYSFYQSTYRPVKKSKEDFEKPSGIYKSFRFEDLKVYGFRDVVMKFFNFEKIYTAEEYIDFLDALSDHRGLPDEKKLALYEGIKQAILKHGNSYKVNYLFQLYMGRK